MPNKIEIAAMITLDSEGAGEVECKFSDGQDMPLLKKGLKHLLMRLEEEFPEAEA